MDERIGRAIRLIEARMGEEPDYAAIARAVGLSHHRFHHLFVEERGETPGAFLRRIRLDLAAMRLRWTKETVGAIAHGLGYRSQSSFNAAFVARFGEKPRRFRDDVERWPNKATDKVADPRIRLRHSDGFRCVARRYFGPYANVPQHWRDFAARLPDIHRAPARGLFLGLTYDDPRFTPPEQIRYDCCVVSGEGEATTEPPIEGFHALVTRPGLHAAVAHAGSYDEIGATYSVVLDNWAADSPYTMADDPALEIYAVPPGLCEPEDLRGTILVPLL